MRTYTTIPKDISKKLSCKDIYRFTCIALAPRDKKTRTYTDITYKQIAKYSNANKPEPESTIKSFVKRLKELDIINILEAGVKEKNTISRRNYYYFPHYKEDFRFIHSSLLELDIDIALKGFLIHLNNLTINNTGNINYSINKIVSLVKVGKPTAIKYIQKLIELDLLAKTDKGYQIETKYFTSSGKSIKQIEIESIYRKVVESGFLLDRFIKTDWKKIANPIDYWRSVEGGCIGLKSNEIMT